VSSGGSNRRDRFGPGLAIPLIAFDRPRIPTRGATTNADHNRRASVAAESAIYCGPVLPVGREPARNSVESQWEGMRIQSSRFAKKTLSLS